MSGILSLELVPKDFRAHSERTFKALFDAPLCTNDVQLNDPSIMTLLGDGALSLPDLTLKFIYIEPGQPSFSKNLEASFSTKDLFPKFALKENTNYNSQSRPDSDTWPDGQISYIAQSYISQKDVSSNYIALRNSPPKIFATPNTILQRPRTVRVTIANYEGYVNFSNAGATTFSYTPGEVAVFDNTEEDLAQRLLNFQCTTTSASIEIVEVDDPPDYPGAGTLDAVIHLVIPSPLRGDIIPNILNVAEMDNNWLQIIHQIRENNKPLYFQYVPVGFSMSRTFIEYSRLFSGPSGIIKDVNLATIVEENVFLFYGNILDSLNLTYGRPPNNLSYNQEIFANFICRGDILDIIIIRCQNTSSYLYFIDFFQKNVSKIVYDDNVFKNTKQNVIFLQDITEKPSSDYMTVQEGYDLLKTAYPNCPDIGGGLKGYDATELITEALETFVKTNDLGIPCEYGGTIDMSSAVETLQQIIDDWGK